MASIIAVLSILVVAGAFMWLQPSARDKYLARLRSEAITSGFLIGSIRLPDTSEYGRVKSLYRIETLYQLSIELIDDDNVAFTVVRTSGESGAFLPDGWTWEHRASMNQSVYQAVSALLVNLPLSVEAVVVKKDTVGLVWDEKSPELTLDWIKTKLTAVASICSLQVRAG